MGEMTRRERAFRARNTIARFAVDEDFKALAEEFDDLVAFYDAAIEEGLAEANEAHLRYQEVQGE